MMTSSPFTLTSWIWLSMMIGFRTVVPVFRQVSPLADTVVTASTVAIQRNTFLVRMKEKSSQAVCQRELCGDRPQWIHRRIDVDPDQRAGALGVGAFQFGGGFRLLAQMRVERGHVVGREVL